MFPVERQPPQAGHRYATRGRLHRTRSGGTSFLGITEKLLVPGGYSQFFQVVTACNQDLYGYQPVDLIPTFIQPLRRNLRLGSLRVGYGRRRLQKEHGWRSWLPIPQCPQILWEMIWSRYAGSISSLPGTQKSH